MNGEQVNGGCLVSCIQLHERINLKRSIEFAINNVLSQGNNVKTKFNLKVKEICRDWSPNFLWNKRQPTSFCSDFSEAHIKPCETLNMKCFAEIANGWIQSTICKEIHLRSLNGSEYVSDYLRGFSIITNSSCHFESSRNLYNLISILFKYLQSSS